MTVRAPQTQPGRPAFPARAAVATLAVGALALGACARSTGSAGAGAPAVSAAAAGDAGAPTPAGAVEGFIAAARANDARTMGLLFGTAAGPVAARDPGTDVEKRMRALACYLSVDGARVTDDAPAVGAGARRYVNVALRQRELSREVRFTAVPTPRGRWLVESFDIERVSDFCRPGS